MGDSRFNPLARNYAGPNQVLDARGRPLAVDDEILLHLPRPLYYRVAGIAPAVHPEAPVGAMVVHVGVMLTFTVKRNAPVAELVRVRTAEEAGPSNYTLTEVAPDTPGGLKAGN